MRFMSLIAGFVLVLTISAPAQESEPAPSTAPAAAAQRAENPIKVGWVVSLSTFEHPTGHGPGGRADSVTAIRKRLIDPEVELFALIEPGTEENEDVINVVRSNFEADHVVSGADAAELAKLDVIVCSRAWAVKDEVLEAVAKAVEGGVGLFRHLPLRSAETQDGGEIVEKLLSIKEPEYYFERALVDCRVVADHPVLTGLRGNLEDGKTQISALHGMRGIVRGTPLIVLEDELSTLSNVDSDGKAKDEVGAKPPEDQKIFCPLYVAELGKGRILACQWDSMPKSIVEHTKGRFYVHCVQWLAKRPVK